MIINGTSYKVIYPLEANWVMAIDRDPMTTGFYDSTDYLLASDHVIANIIVKDTRDNLTTLLTYLNNTQSYNMTTEGEKLFGPHVRYDGITFNCRAFQVKPVMRQNMNFWQLEIPMVVQNIELDPTITASLDNLLYPETYVGGQSLRNEIMNIRTYGGVYISSSGGDTSMNDLTFTLKDSSVAGEVLKAFIEVIRADAFALPAKWISLKPFGEMTFNSAFVMGLSYSQNSLKEYTISLKLQGYNA